ncbi:uncharacterized protein LOC111133589 [Crassostrea virginica]
MSRRTCCQPSSAVRMKAVVCVIIASLNFGTVLSQCNVSMAEMCAAQLQERYDFELLSEITTPHQNVTESRKLLCLSSIKGNNITRCFKDNSKSCVNQDHLAIQWNDTLKSVTNLCNETCSNYQEFQACESKIQYRAYRESKYQLFCTSYEESISCASEILKNCKFNLSFFVDIIKQPIPVYYKQLCRTGCVNLDDTMKVIDSCYGSISNIMSEDPATQCKSHNNFKECLFKPDKVCREVTQLLQGVYSYDTLEIICTTTTSTTTTTTTTTPPSTTTTTSITTTSTPSTATTSQLTTKEGNSTTQSTTTPPPPTTTATTEDKTTLRATTSQQLQTEISLTFLDSTVIPTTTLKSLPSTSKSALSRKTTETTHVPESVVSQTSPSVSSALECVDKEILSLSSVDQLSAEMCLRFLTMTACLYEKDITKQDDIRNIHSIIGNVVNSILSRGMLKNCTFNIQKEIRLIEELNNSTCQQRQKQLEEEDEPLCSGHGYGLVKCRNGASSPTWANVLLTLSSLCVSIALFQFILSI